MGNDNLYINALWIDDLRCDPNSDEFFEDLADAQGINIVNVTNVDDGITKLQNPSLSFDAIILDINCYKHNSKDEVIDMDALTYALNRLKDIGCTIPHFVYSALGSAGNTVVNLVIPEINPWDNRKIYHKTKDRNDLFEAIKKAVANSEDIQIKMQFSDAFGFIDDGKLLNIVKSARKKSFNNDSFFPKSIREPLEDIAHKFESLDMIVLNKYKNNHSKDFSEYLGSNNRYEDLKIGNKFVPSYILRSLHMLSECSNEASHEYSKGVENYKIPFHLQSGKAPYLNHILFFELMQVLVWCNSLPLNDEKWRNEWKEYFNQIKSSKY